MQCCPYTYLIGWSKTNQYYYGVRYAKGCHPSDLWNPYKTSSKEVHDYINQFGDPDIIEVRKTFNNIDSARTWESKVLKRMRVVVRSDFLNKTDNKAILNTKEHYVKLGELLKKREVSKTTRLKMRNSKLKLMESGWKRHNPALREEIKIKMSVSRKGTRTGGDNPNAKAIIYNNQTYDCKKQLSISSGLSLYKINNMIKKQEIMVV